MSAAALKGTVVLGMEGCIYMDAGKGQCHQYRPVLLVAGRKEGSVL